MVHLDFTSFGDCSLPLRLDRSVDRYFLDYIHLTRFGFNTENFLNAVGLK